MVPETHYMFIEKIFILFDTRYFSEADVSKTKAINHRFYVNIDVQVNATKN